MVAWLNSEPVKMPDASVSKVALHGFWPEQREEVEWHDEWPFRSYNHECQKHHAGKIIAVFVDLKLKREKDVFCCSKHCAIFP